MSAGKGAAPDIGGTLTKFVVGTEETMTDTGGVGAAVGATWMSVSCCVWVNAAGSAGSAENTFDGCV